MLGPTVLFELTVAGGFDVLVTVNVRMHVHPDSIRLTPRVVGQLALRNSS
jgi:hypothetical protein